MGRPKPDPPPATEIGRRFFVSIGVDRPGGSLRDLTRVARDAERMRRLFGGLGYRPVPFARNPSAGHLRASWQRWLANAELGRSDAVIVYYSGHGCVAHADHYLCMAGFNRDQLATTAFKTQDLVELALRRKARPGKLWLILDCCQAGAVLNEGLYRALGDNETETFILAASGAWGQVLDGSFSGALHDVLDEAAQRSAAPSLDGITQAINDRWTGPRAVQAGFSSSRFDFLDRVVPGESPKGRR